MTETYLAFTVYVAQKEHAENNGNLRMLEGWYHQGEHELTISNWGKIRLRHMLDSLPLCPRLTYLNE